MGKLSRRDTQSWFVNWAIVEVVANGIPAGLGQPLYGKLDAEIAAAMMSINAVKGVEIGGGFALSALDGAQAGMRCVWPTA